MDFFTVTAAGTDALAAVSSPAIFPAAANNHDTTTTVAFAEAINARYSRKGSTVLIPLSPAASSTTPDGSPTSIPLELSIPLPLPVPTKPPLQPTMSAASTSPARDFIPVPPASLHDVLESALVIDIRPHNAYALARLPNALSLSVPSTLLKRPLFSLDKLAQMLSSVQARDKFSQWPEALSIFVYDADSGVLNEGGNLVGLLRKFRKEGYPRKLFWLQGGFKAVWREAQDIVDQNQLVEEDEASVAAAPTPPAGLLRTKHLPMSAFTTATTTTSRQVPLPPAVGRGSADPISLRLPNIARTASMSTSSLPSSLPTSSLSNSASTPSFSKSNSLSLHLPLSGKNALTATIPEGKMLHLFPPVATNAASSLPTSGMSAAYNVVPRPHYKSMPSGHSMAFNPFFDNIRQNIELGGGRGSGEGIPLKLPRRVRRRVEELPFEWLREIGRKSGTLVNDIEEDETMGEEVGKALENGGKIKSKVKMAHASKIVASDIGSVGPTTNVTKVVKKRQRKRSKKNTDSSRLHPSPSSSSSESNSPPPDSSEVSYSASASQANSKAGSVSPPLWASTPVQPLPSQSQPTSKSPQEVTRDASEGETSGDDLAKTLAMQFYKIELGEQRRLMGVMDHHSKESTNVSSSSTSRSSLSSSTTPSSYVSGGYAGMMVLPGLDNGPSNGAGSTSTSGSGSSSAATVQPNWLLSSTGSGVASTMTTGTQSSNEERCAIGTRQSVFPYSITAGVEKGEKNRYRNIWPFEHARVRLQKSCPEDDDYMNASYVQPLGTNKRYIATQGPLPATFTDFWMLCWQENVHVIVMLTREVESALIKCGNYWAEGDYGPLSLKLISTTDNPEREKRRKEREMSSGFFNFPQMPNGTHKENSGEKEEYTIRRVFQLTNKMYPEAKPRIVTQLQYLDWPDLDVPKDPRGLLELMREVDEVVENARAEGDMQWGEGPWNHSPLGTPPKEERPPSAVSVGAHSNVDPVTGIAKHARGRAPVLLHCSAGVGRTGGFIAVDAVLDGLRREMRKCRQLKVGTGAESSNSSQNLSPLLTSDGEREETMDVDRGIASPLDKALKDTGLTMPVDVGGNEVHVPIAGPSNGQTPMDVDDDHGMKTGKNGRLEASPALLGEVKNGHAKVMAAMADRDGVSHRSLSSVPSAMDVGGKFPKPGLPQPGVRYSDASSGTSSARQSTSLSGNSIMSSSHTSTTSLTQAMKGVDPSLGSMWSSPVQNPSTVRSAPNASRGGLEMDSWRKAVSSTQSNSGCRSDVPNAPPNSSQGPQWVQDTVLASPRGMTFDYVEPRRLHDNRSPPLLSSYDEPIRRVIEDMREQRMSLCQSLRQYVFVHRAIIEGTLKIMEQERYKQRVVGEDVEMVLPDVPVTAHSHPSTFVQVSSARSKVSKLPISPMPFRPPGLDRVESMGLGPALVLEEHGIRNNPLSQVSSADLPLDVVTSIGIAGSPRAKRQASPTELVSEDAKGVPRLTKRASVKRRPFSPPQSKDEEGGMQLGSLMLSSPSPPRSQ